MRNGYQPPDDPRAKQRPPTEEEKHQALLKQYDGNWRLVWVYEWRWGLIGASIFNLGTILDRWLT